MVVPDELSFVLRKLEALGVEYALTGSLASTVWGSPRATYDADVVIAMTAGDIDKLMQAFPQPEWYLDRDSVVHALHDAGEFNVIHAASGTKIDFWIKTNRPVDLMRFRRRRREALHGVECWILSPEDTILAKLEWISAAPSDRQQGDVAGVFAVQADRLDLEYLRDWADRLGVRDLLEQAVTGNPDAT